MKHRRNFQPIGCAQFKGIVVEARPGERVDSLLKRFSRIHEFSGNTQAVRDHEYHRKKSARIKEKRRRAMALRRKEEKLAERFMKS